MKQQNFIIESENQSQIFMGFTEGYLYHAHLRLELMFVFEGNVNVIVENSQYALKQGDILIVNPFERHAYFATDKNTRAFFIMFPNTFTTQISDMLSNKIFSQTAITNPQLFKETSIGIIELVNGKAVMFQIESNNNWYYDFNGYREMKTPRRKTLPSYPYIVGNIFSAVVPEQAAVSTPHKSYTAKYAVSLFLSPTATV